MREELLVEPLKALVSERPTYGYRRIWALLRTKLKKRVNHKKVYRLMKQENLLLTRAPRKPTRTHDGVVVTAYNNQRWCSDAFTIQCENGDAVNVVFSMDTCDREAMSYIASTGGITAQNVRDLILESTESRFGSPKAPQGIQWLTDNGKCFTAKDTVAFARELGFDVRTTPAYSPQSNGVAEAFVKTFKRDYVWFGDLSSAEAVMRQLPFWFEDYNNNAPHKGLGMKSPREFLNNLKLAS
jgi:transposase InsO family protein